MKTRTAAALALLALAGIAHAASPGRVALRYRAGAARDYSIVTRMDELVRSDGGEPDRKSDTTERRIRRRMLELEDGGLELVLVIEDRNEDGDVRSRNEMRRKLSSTGVALGESGESTEEMAEEVMLALPTRPLRVGDTWTSEVRSSARAGTRVPMEHRLETVGILEGHRVARILSTLEEDHEASGTRTQVKVRTQTLFDLDAGDILESKTVMKTRMIYPESDLGIPGMTVSRRIRRKITGVSRELPGPSASGPPAPPVS